MSFKKVTLALASCVVIGFVIFKALYFDGGAVSHNRTESLIGELRDETLPKVLVIAHRACWFAGAPENSLEAISECIRLGAEFIEIDVRLTADGIPVLLHDETVDRTTNGTGPINKFDLDSVRKLRLLSGAGGEEATLTDQRVPTLEEALVSTKGNILVNLDVKSDVFDKAFEVVEHLDVQDEILMKMRALPDDPKLKTAKFLGRTMFMPIIKECVQHKPDNTNKPPKPCAHSLYEIIPDYEVYNPVAYEIGFGDIQYLIDGVPAMRKFGGRIWVNTLEERHAAGHTDDKAIIDPDAHWGILIKQGVNMIQTDRPRALVQYLKETGLR